MPSSPVLAQKLHSPVAGVCVFQYEPHSLPAAHAGAHTTPRVTLAAVGRRGPGPLALGMPRQKGATRALGMSHTPRHAPTGRYHEGFRLIQ